jgi:P4 family phage/plasmid primase-like protien
VLQPLHAHEIHTQSAVAPVVAEARGYRTLDDSPESRQTLEALGFKPFVWDREDAYPGLLVPMHNSRGEQCGAQFKPAVPRSRVKENGERVPVKYETPTGAPLVVDVPAFTREHMTNLDLTLWITEGMKKTDALVSQGLPALGLTGVFNWRSRMGALGDWEDIPLKGRPVAVCFDADASGNRNVQMAMARLGAWLKSRGASKVHYVVTPGAVGDVATKGVDDFFAAGGTLEALAAAQLDSPPGQGAVDAAFTDAFLVEELASEALEGQFMWTSGLGWLSWTGAVWKRVPDVAPLEAARVWASARFDAVLDASKADKSQNFGAKITGWRGVLSKNRISALVAMARGIPGILADASEFDTDPDLLTVENGTVHLPTGQLRPHAASDRITKCAPSRYVPGYRHPLFQKALEALPEESRPYLKDRFGQAVTGYMTPDHVMVVSHGDGENGKSTLADLMLRTIGESDSGGYGVQISDRVLMSSPSDHPTELMDLRGARYAVLEETPEARHLNVQRLKSVVGTPRMKARHIRQDTVAWQSTHSLFVNTNHRPIVAETDHGSWRRLALLTYPYKFVKRESLIVRPNDRLGDPALQYASSDPAVRQAMLTWLIEGAQEFYARGRVMLEPPAGVEADTHAWRAESDQVVGFASECLEFDPQAWTSTEDMLKAFNAWLDSTGHRPWNALTLGTRMSGHSVMVDHHVEQARKTIDGRKLRGWAGVRVSRSANPFRG